MVLLRLGKSAFTDEMLKVFSERFPNEKFQTDASNTIFLVDSKMRKREIEFLVETFECFDLIFEDEYCQSATKEITCTKT